MGCHQALQQRCIILPIQDQVVRFDSQRGATCKVDAKTPLRFAYREQNSTPGNSTWIKAK